MTPSAEPTRRQAPLARSDGFAWVAAAFILAAYTLGLGLFSLVPLFFGFMFALGGTFVGVLRIARAGPVTRPVEILGCLVSAGLGTTLVLAVLYGDDGSELVWAVAFGALAVLLATNQAARWALRRRWQRMERTER